MYWLAPQPGILTHDATTPATKLRSSLCFGVTLEEVSQAQSHCCEGAPIRTAARQVRRAERQSLGLAAIRCAWCIEEHHPAGRSHDPGFTVPLCQKHHDEMHELMRQAEVSLSFEADPKRKVAMALRGMAIYHRAEADAFERFADLLEKSA